MSFFEWYPELPPDPILELTTAYKSDPRGFKVNLGVGAYRNSQGEPETLSCVKKAEKLIFDSQPDKEYQPIDGNKQFCEEILKLVFGSDRPKNVYAAQAAGGTGALSLAAGLLKQRCDTIYVSDPSWANHRLIFSRLGLRVIYYPYFVPSEHLCSYKKMAQFLETLEPGSVVLLHVCCHNPTGCDLMPDEWRELSKLMKRKKLFPFFDFAYQGFAESLDADAYPVRLFAEEGHEFFCAYSCSKNFGLYGERVGALIVHAKNKRDIATMITQVKQQIRSTISQTPLHGGRIAAKLLEDPDLKKEWIEELTGMRFRMWEMRQEFAASLSTALPHHNWDFIRGQHGMFSFCGLTPEVVEKLRDTYAIYMPSSGRISFAGLTSKNIPYVVEAIANETK
jgi:aspartate/tyrosine/aromatic aminotransferase